MTGLIQEVFAAPLATLFIVSGILFLLIAVVGTITGKIDPGDKARMAAGVIGLFFIVLGLTMHFQGPPPPLDEGWIGGGTNDLTCIKICEGQGKMCLKARRKAAGILIKATCEFTGVSAGRRWKECLCK